jgi:hypothetical protein
MLKTLILLKIERAIKVTCKSKATGLHFQLQGDQVKIKSGLIGRSYGISRKEDLSFQVKIKGRSTPGLNL